MREKEELRGFFPFLAGAIVGAMLGATICQEIALTDCECPQVAPAVSPLFTPMPEGQIGVGSYVRAYPGGYIGYVDNMSTWGDANEHGLSDRPAYHVCVQSWQPPCRWLGETNVVPYATDTPEPTATPGPAHVFADNAEISADVCANVYGRVIYPATLTLNGAVTEIGTLHGPLAGYLSGYYQACPVEWDYEDCLYVPAENVTLRERECATPTPVCECW